MVCAAAYFLGGLVTFTSCGVLMTRVFAALVKSPNCRPPRLRVPQLRPTTTFSLFYSRSGYRLTVNRSTKAVLGGVSVLALLSAGAAVFLLNPSSIQSGLTRSSNSTSNSEKTLQDLVAGRFPTALDKAGTGGVTVTVRGLQVLYVHDESDGDWHVGVTDGKLPIFITEITPSYQPTLGRPTVGTVIDETGVPYCDTFHETESWHGNTCWEIHPVTSWHLAGSGTSTQTVNRTLGLSLNATISFALNPIQRGSTQTITVSVSDSDGPVPGANASIEVDYASGYTVHNFACLTATNGSCSISWTIGSTSTPGVFRVIIDVEGESFDSSFVVTS